MSLNRKDKQIEEDLARILSKKIIYCSRCEAYEIDDLNDTSMQGVTILHVPGGKYKVQYWLPSSEVKVVDMVVNTLEEVPAAVHVLQVMAS